MKRTLNDRMIKALRPAAAGKRTELWDAIVPGLGIRVTEHGAKTFVLAARYPGSPNPARRSLGGYGEISLEQARAKAREWLALIQRGVDPGAELERARVAEQRKTATTFGAVAQAFIEEKLPQERRGRETERILRKDVIPVWQNRPIAEIKPIDVVLLLKPIKARGPYMAHATLSAIKRLFGWAVDSQIYGLEISPADRLKPRSLIGEKQSRSRILSDDEIRAFWRACDRMSHPHGDLGKLLLLTGTRHREAAAAPWSEFDLTKKTWTIGQERFKSAVPHIIPLTEDMIALIESLPRAGKYLFTTAGNAVPTDITEKVKAKIDADMTETLGGEPKPWVIHDLRRTMRTHLAALQVPDHVAEMILGHGRKGLQRIYDQHRYEAEMRQALERWNARLRSIVDPPQSNVIGLRKGFGGRPAANAC
jgi:integrase